MFDYLVVGAGLYGATFARIMAEEGKTCLVVEKRDHVGGNCADAWADDCLIGLHGGHIFHTNSEKVWKFVNRFATFWPYRHRVMAYHKGQYISVPINMHTFYELKVASEPIEAQKMLGPSRLGDNLEEAAINRFGEDVFEKIIKHYTEKQWGRKCNELPPEIVYRIPVRFTWNGDYFDDTFQGMPKRGYTALVAEMLVHPKIAILLNTDYISNKANLSSKARKTLYTGPIDALYSYDMGKLEYRSLTWEDYPWGEYCDQGVATVNMTDNEWEHTREIYWDYFMEKRPKTRLMSKEFPVPHDGENEPYYPINDDKNNRLAKLYRERAEEEGIIVGGRLGLYRYINMDQAIAAAMKDARNELS